jgi:hypothetical protein
MIKSIHNILFGMFVIMVCLSSCSSLTGKMNLMGAEDIISFTDKTAKGVDWIKGVTDLGMGIACISGKVNKDICNKYDQISTNASIIISNANKSVENYKTTGTAISQDQVKKALTDLMKVNFKLDTVYKTPVEQIKEKDL